MPIFDYECPSCGHVNEFLVFPNDRDAMSRRKCSRCDCGIFLNNDPKLPGAPSFKIKGMRAANGYGLKSVDTYGVNKVDGYESGYSFTGKGGTTDHNQGQARKADDKRSMAERKAS